MNSNSSSELFCSVGLSSTPQRQGESTDENVVRVKNLDTGEEVAVNVTNIDSHPIFAHEVDDEDHFLRRKRVQRFDIADLTPCKKRDRIRRWVLANLRPMRHPLEIMNHKPNMPSVWTSAACTTSRCVSKSFEPFKDFWLVRRLQAPQCIWALAMDQEGVWLAAGTQDGTISLWKVKRNAVGGLFNDDPEICLTGHSGPVVHIEFSRGSRKRIASASFDKTILIWDLDAGRHAVNLIYCSDYPSAVVFNPHNDSEIVAGFLDATVQAWRMNPDRAEADMQEYLRIPDLVTSLSINPGSTLMAVGVRSGRAILYYYPSYRFLAEIDCRRPGRASRKVTGFDWSDEWLMVTTADSRISAVSIQDLSVVKRFRGHTQKRSMLKGVLSSRSSLLIAGSETDEVYVWPLVSSCKTEDTYQACTLTEATNVTCLLVGPVPFLKFALEEIYSVLGRSLHANGTLKKDGQAILSSSTGTIEAVVVATRDGRVLFYINMGSRLYRWLLHYRDGRVLFYIKRGSRFYRWLSDYINSVFSELTSTTERGVSIKHNAVATGNVSQATV